MAHRFVLPFPYRGLAQNPAAHEIYLDMTYPRLFKRWLGAIAIIHHNKPQLDDLTSRQTTVLGSRTKGLNSGTDWEGRKANNV